MEAQEFEAQWWGSCVNTYGEETKQLVYASRLGLEAVNVGAPGPVIDLGTRSVVDLGGGPVSILLKCRGIGVRTVVDPCPYPSWIDVRYGAAGINYIRGRAEDFDCSDYDEAWLYNVLQHVDDPARVVANARKARVVRIFEWIGVPAHEGHPHELTPASLREWIGPDGESRIETLNEGGCVGVGWYGVFEQ